MEAIFVAVLLRLSPSCVSSLAQPEGVVAAGGHPSKLEDACGRKHGMGLQGPCWATAELQRARARGSVVRAGVQSE